MLDHEWSKLRLFLFRKVAISMSNVCEARIPSLLAGPNPSYDTPLMYRSDDVVTLLAPPDVPCACPVPLCIYRFSA